MNNDCYVTITVDPFSIYYSQWRIQMGARGMRPSGGPNSFNFMQFLRKFGKIVCWGPRGVGTPPRGNPGSATDSNYNKKNAFNNGGNNRQGPKTLRVNKLQRW